MTEQIYFKAFDLESNIISFSKFDNFVPVKEDCSKRGAAEGLCFPFMIRSGI